MSAGTWAADARAFVLRFVETLTGPSRTFSGNDLWPAGLPRPEDGRHLNNVLLRMERDGLIRRTGEKVASSRGHGTKICVWEVTA